MTRLTALALAGLLALSGRAAAPPTAGDANVTIIVPEYAEYPDRKPPRLYSLKIDGKDFTEPKPEPGSRVRLKVSPAPGKDTVEMIMTFYPVVYSKTVRTKRVKLKPGQKAIVDFTVEDAATPDWYQPIFVPSPMALMRDICKFAKVKGKDTVMDIGCGDGRLVITAVKEFKAKKGIGIDINEDLVKLCQANARKAGVMGRAQFEVGDALKIKNLSHCDVVFLYLGEDLTSRLEGVLRRTLKPGARVVSLDFPIGTWEPDATRKIVARNDMGKEFTYSIYLWTIKEKPKE